MTFRRRYGPWAVIAGGSDGIGAAFGHELAARGLNVLLVARTATTLEQLAGEIATAHSGIEVRTLAVDLSDPDSTDAVAHAAAPLDVGCLVYNVGSEPCYGDLVDHHREFVVGRLHRNIVTKTLLTQHFAGTMRPRGSGGIVLMGSLAGYAGGPGFALYSASKAYTRYLAEGLWFEYRKHGIDLVCPVIGSTQTPTMTHAYGVLEGAREPADVARAALDRLGTGPIWIDDDISAEIDALETMPPEERSIAVAAWAREFAATRGKRTSSSAPAEAMSR